MMTNRYDYGYKEPTLDEWKAAFDNAPACHHPSATNEIIPVAKLPDMEERLLVKLACENLDSELELMTEIDPPIGE